MLLFMNNFSTIRKPEFWIYIPLAWLFADNASGKQLNANASICHSFIIIDQFEWNPTALRPVIDQFWTEGNHGS